MNTGVMMLLGTIAFSVTGTSYDKLVRKSTYKWTATNTIGSGTGHPRYQFLGLEGRTLTMDGKVYPGQYGTTAQLLLLDQLATAGTPLPLYTGNGLTLGVWCINSYTQTDAYLVDTGDAQSVTFSISLSEYMGLDSFLKNQFNQYVKEPLKQAIKEIEDQEPVSQGA